ncbi:MAG: hypothetical protein ACM3SQ_05790 [Betaproteobacteria bacterium]
MTLIKGLAVLAAAAGLGALATAPAFAQSSRQTTPDGPPPHHQRSDGDRRLTTLRGRLAP